MFCSFESAQIIAHENPLLSTHLLELKNLPQSYPLFIPPHPHKQTGNQTYCLTVYTQESAGTTVVSRKPLRSTAKIRTIKREFPIHSAIIYCCISPRQAPTQADRQSDVLQDYLYSEECEYNRSVKETTPFLQANRQSAMLARQLRQLGGGDSSDKHAAEREPGPLPALGRARRAAATCSAAATARPSTPAGREPCVGLGFACLSG